MCTDCSFRFTIVGGPSDGDGGKNEGGGGRPPETGGALGALPGGSDDDAFGGAEGTWDGT